MAQATPLDGRVVDVAAAVIERSDGSYLLGQRPSGKVYAGYWEFPGGKVEAGEEVSHALARELREELGIDVETAYPWITRDHTYPHATVRLHFHRVVRWRGEPRPHEGQVLAWQRGAQDVGPMLPANGPVLKSLALPVQCAITRAWQVGMAQALAELDVALRDGLRLIQIREEALGAQQRSAFAEQVVERVRAVKGLILVNGDPDLAARIGADGVHLKARELWALERRPSVAWCGASCHDAAELKRAVELGVDFALLGAVRNTPSHPGRTGIGWDGFVRLARYSPIPLFALGGMRPEDLDAARRAGAHGIAMIRGAWGDQGSSGG